MDFHSQDGFIQAFTHARAFLLMLQVKMFIFGLVAAWVFTVVPGIKGNTCVFLFRFLCLFVGAVLLLFVS